MRLLIHSKGSQLISTWLYCSVRGLTTTGIKMNNESPVVKLPDLGSLEGGTKETPWTKQKFYEFLGVKYAESPSGKLRFKAPVPVKPWNGVRKATELGTPAPCMRIMSKYKPEQFKGDLEDCLNLSIYTKDLNGKKPVIVFIHGGGFFEGAAFMHPGDYFMEKDVVLVVPQYRVGPLGFLSTKTDEIPGNAGILDVMLAFEWVKKNIVHFGGDPNQVTAAGQSAGAAIVSALIYSPIVPTDLFNKVILQSGGATGTWVWDDNPERNARDMARRAGIDPKLPTAEIDQAFMKMDPFTLCKVFTKQFIQGTLNGINSIGGHRMTIGGPTNFLPETPFEIMRKDGGRKDLPMLTGVVKHEGTFSLIDIVDYGFGQEKFDPHWMLDHILHILGINDVTTSYISYAMKNLYTPEQLDRGLYRELAGGFIDLCGTFLIKSPVMRMAQINAKTNKENTYLYTLDYKGEHTRYGYGRDVSKYMFDGGVHHSDDNIYLFPWPSNVAILNTEDHKIAEKMIDLWTSFAANGKPESPKVETEWPAFTNFVGPYLHIDSKCTVGYNFLDEFSVAAREYQKNLGIETVDSAFGKILKSPEVKK